MVKPDVFEEKPVPAPLYHRSHVDWSRIISRHQRLRPATNCWVCDTVFKGQTHRIIYNKIQFVLYRELYFV
jgi:hypothetical protein